MGLKYGRLCVDYSDEENFRIEIQAIEAIKTL